MKKLFKLLLTIVFIGAIVYFAPKLVHKCDSCEEWFVGTGYEANVIADVIADVISDDDQVIPLDEGVPSENSTATFERSIVSPVFAGIAGLLKSTV